MKTMLTGNEAAAHGARLANVKIISAYPITPQTTIVEKIAEFEANGEIDAKYIRVESEHSAMATCIAAENTGVRTFTATSSHGLALMHEMLMWAAGARLPIVMSVVNRAMGPPWSIWSDQQDTIAQRDTGWMQIYAENNQEVLDSILMAYKIAEDPAVLLPMMVIEDAFILSHTTESIDLPLKKDVLKFLPDYKPEFKLDISNPAGFGSLVMPDGPFMEFRHKSEIALEQAKTIIKKVDLEFKEQFGRSYGGLVENYMTEDAEYIITMLGSTASTAKYVVNKMRSEGKKVGLLKIRSFRPFPVEEIRNTAKNVKVLGVMDKSYTYGHGGALFNEVTSSLYNHKSAIVKNYITGLGGRDITPELIEQMFENMIQIGKSGLDKEIEWVNLNIDLEASL
ncbi:MAG: pyruvate ferredoxin oxidoreductase [Thermoplasmata archaeon]